MGTAAKRTRENRAITVDFRDETTYFQLLGDGKTFVEFVCAFILSLGFQLAHKATCRGGGCLTRHSDTVNLPSPSSRCTLMLAAPSRDWNVFKQIFAEHWDGFTHAHPHYRTSY